jgi:arginyl-tRNA synthetase
MTNPLAQLREECQKLLEETLAVTFPEETLPQAKYSLPPSPEMGELSSPVCFQLARRIRQSPAKIAQNLVENMNIKSSSLVEMVKPVNGYINFFTGCKYSKLVLETAINIDEEYGFLKTKKPEKVMVEHTSANPNGPIHIGNARNSIIGSCLANLLKKRGHDVVIHYLVNDMGRQVAMATYGWRLLEKPKPEGIAELWVGTIYASVNVISETIKLKKALEEAEKNGWVHEAKEARDNLKEYEIATKELRTRFPDIYD